MLGAPKMKTKSKAPQRFVMLGILAILVVVLGFVYTRANDTGIAVGAPNAASPTGDTALAAADSNYYTSPEYIRPASNFAGCEIVFFSASWDSFSLRARELIKTSLEQKPDVCAVELDISEHRSEADEFGVNMPPAIVIFDQGTYKTYNNLNPQQVSRLLSTIE
jgi:hypothetical protein